MTNTTHAWFSAAASLSYGSSVYRKRPGFIVNMTRVNERRESKSSHRHDEQYLGAVVLKEEGGEVGPRKRVQGITRGF